MKKNYNVSLDIQPNISIYPLVVRFPDDDYIYDFSIMEDNLLVRVFAYAFKLYNGSLTKSSKKRSFGDIKKFLFFLKLNSTLEISKLNKRQLISYAQHIDQNKNLSLSSKYHSYNSITNLVKEIFKIKNSPLTSFIIPINPFKNPHSESERKNKLTFEQLESLLKACHQDIDEHIKNKSEITPHVLFPFYLALMLELIANPTPLFEIDINCIQEDPLFESRAFIEWNKRRASRVQRRNVLKNQKYGAYSIIHSLLELTSDIRNTASVEYQSRLFICIKNNQVNIPSPRAFEHAIPYFIKKHNLNFDFNLSEIRPSVLTNFYSKHKDIIAISKLANHQNVRTTLLYVVDDNTKKENNIFISKKQSEIIPNLFKKDSDEINVQIDSNNIEYANVGFNCQKPIINKNVCVNWMAELTNPDLIIPNSPKYLAKIIKLKEEILIQKNYILEDRFSLLYEPILYVINQEILPQFDKNIINQANQLKNDIKIPLLGAY